MSTIEQAAKRLEQLRRAGVDVSELSNSTTDETNTSGIAEPNSALPDTPVLVAHEPNTPAPAATPSTTSAPVSDRKSRQIDLDFLKMQRAGLLVPGQPRSQLEEEIRIIKRPLLDNVKEQSAIRPERANLIMVTSAMAGEGKTQTALNLAVSMAMELDYTVLLVEADVIRPTALERLGVKADKGLLDLLQHPGMDLSDVLLKTNIPKLTLLPTGTGNARSTELLASGAMSHLLNELASKYNDRVIVFDTPPLLSTTESRVLAAQMGQVVMVVEAAKTSLTMVKQAFATVEDHPVVMTVLNKYRGPKGHNTYGYYAP
ncbi:MAG: AAA family ATPase [Aquabacterium sp.]|uniref:XrtA-associated tyrosine autokinase n=1 Tax=Aquabacterium sp. TaxID=1872578 RepID=UPI0025B80ACB|nr:XrtA-associated tyrosine autokinase [Aquabacterium sp.]MBI5926158.1 AAA family ATPase [Aquabacterium sp.]